MNLKVGTVDRGLVYESSLVFLCQNFTFLLVVAHIGVQSHTQQGDGLTSTKHQLFSKVLKKGQLSSVTYLLENKMDWEKQIFSC